MGNAADKIIEQKRCKMELEYEARKRDVDLRDKEFKNRHTLEIRKSEADYQHKIAELITEMKKSKLQAGKELALSYINTMNLIIEQNSTIFESAEPLLQRLENGKLPESVKKATENFIEKLFNKFMTTEDLLEFSKQQIKDLQLKQDKEFSRLLDIAVDQKVITLENKIYLLED
ncbi:13735_t:CDS:2 [Acaulospora morrowiae]|uniref:13735_t:CDS:1 n=1 Tax=Acaulospora morrowiae TaxID=94023 RepID=A0A9N9HED2_9GLOM|nr:13735_t:CDS:2 [Acaulospora morrowiae]